MRWYREYLVSFPDRPGGGAEQLPARRAAVRGQALRRGERRVREDRLRLPGACEERRRRLRRAARLRAAAEEGAAAPSCRRCSAPASTARCASPRPSRRPARRPGARRRRREAVRAEDGDQAATVAQRVIDAAAAGGRRAAPRRLDRDRAHRRSRANAFDRAEKALRRGARSSRPSATPARNDLVERQAAADLQAGRAGARRRPDARRGRPLRPRRRPSRRSRRVRADGAVRRRGGADRAEGLGRRDPHARGLPHALPEPRAAGRGRAASSPSPTSRRASGRRPPASSSAWPPRSKDPKIARDALWQAAELYEKARLARRRRPGPTSATCAVPAAARAGGRGALAPGAASPRPTATPRARWR